MEHYLPFLRSLQLFEDIDDENILRLLRCMNAKEMYFDQQRVVWEPNFRLPFLCLVVEGGFLLQQEDWRGNRCIIGTFGPGDFLGEDAVGAMEGMLPFYLLAKPGTTVILLSNDVGMNPCAQRCQAHLFFLRNMINALVQNEMRLRYKIEYLSRRTTREKIMSYLTVESARQGSCKLLVDFTRQELADFLSVDRSAMCTELSHMQQDGLIRYKRRHFELLEEKPTAEMRG